MSSFVVIWLKVTDTDNGGVMTTEDLKGYKAYEREPIKSTFRSECKWIGPEFVWIELIY